MLLNKEKRLKYIGFNDLWFVILGVFVTSFITDFLFAGCSFLLYPFWEAISNWGISLLFSICNWLIMRAVMISMRKRFPAFNDSVKRITIFFVLMIVTIVLIDKVGSMVLKQIIGENYNHPSRARLLLPVTMLSIMVIAIYEAIFFFKQLKQSIIHEAEAKQNIVEAQLDALRNQARPHFLFNSLNTLRDIIDNDPKSEAIHFVDKLSDVYRFILESGNHNLISLKEELRFAQSYIHIQSERFSDNLQLSWDISEDRLGAMVIPMSLQLLLENAIKHNIISKSKPLTIKVYTNADQLVVENNIQAKSTQLPSTKIGLSSIQKRYSLISERSLIINNEGRNFIAKIPLLSSIPQK